MARNVKKARVAIRNQNSISDRTTLGETKPGSVEGQFSSGHCGQCIWFRLHYRFQVRLEQSESLANPAPSVWRPESCMETSLLRISADEAVVSMRTSQGRV